MGMRAHIPLPDPLPVKLRRYLLRGYKYDGLHLVFQRKDGTRAVILWAVRNVDQL